MKRTILTIVLVAIAVVSFGQTKFKQKYTVTIPAEDYYRLINAVHEYKDEQVYSLKLNADQKIQVIQTVDMYLWQLSKTVKVDSTVVDTTKIISKPLRK